jgi:PAS domain S-box-containing protein
MDNANRKPGPPLSEREQQLIKLAAEGYTDTAIAAELGIGQATVSTYWGRIRVKMGPYSRTELVALAVRAESEAALATLQEVIERLTEQLNSKVSTVDGSDLYLEILQNGPDAAVVTLANGEIEFVNLALCELFGYKSAELVGKSISILVPERLREQHLNFVMGYVKEPTRRNMGEHLETCGLKRDGTEFPIRAALNQFSFEGRDHVVCMLRESAEQDVLQ